ncbi:hypothetical protein BMETH_1132_0 [methanotrophic bacterial endosymbiont of Bathymodiolus sp.]|nr:hypothetical protein BMETH_1132_0 [methanotrophic bacterial endosymbiont of Bathymodiolus sp.]
MQLIEVGVDVGHGTVPEVSSSTGNRITVMGAVENRILSGEVFQRSIGRWAACPSENGTINHRPSHPLAHRPLWGNDRHCTRCKAEH